ncbi:MAG: FISUMP domain-containing protein, partial [Syntrophothermus sp.]
FMYTPVNGDVITCTVFVPNASCLSNNPATSLPITITVNPLNPVDITVTPSQNNVCQGATVTFTATATPAGGTKHYQWTVNNLPVGTDLPTYSYIPLTGDVVKCEVNVSGLTCLTSNPKTSPPVTMIVNPNVATSVTISAAANPVCSGIPVTFTALPVNGGTPVYQWQVNGVNAGTGLSSYTYMPANGDVITCNMTTSLSCALPVNTNSNLISMSVIASPLVSYTRCTDTITSLNARPIKLKGGIPLGGIYSGPGVNAVTGVFTPSFAGIGNKTITYSYTNSGSCSDSRTRVIKVVNPSVSICGMPFIDIRDGKSYNTIQVGTQCWFAEDLNYGVEISETVHQRDNCINEKYTHHPSPVTGHSIYQWDELMDYTSTPGEKGLCPPGWHVPAEAEWQTLFSNYTNNAFAAAALKYSGFSGFNAQMTGIIPQLTPLHFYQYATIFWTSSSYGSNKAWAHGMNETDPSVSVYPSTRQNAFSVRCLKD